MKFDWSHFLDLAKAMQDASTGALAEAKKRSAMSRAYYATFNLAKEHLETAQGRRFPPEAEQHALVQEAFQEGVDENHARIGVLLQRLRYVRNKADYNPTIPGLDHTCRDSLIQADQLMGLLGKIK